MASKKFVRTEPGLRIDYPDFQHAVEQSQRTPADQIGGYFALGSDNPSRGYVLEGFGASAVGTVVTVQRGVALLPYKEAGEVHYTSVLADGVASRSTDIGSYADGTYFIYVKLEFADTDYENRVKWNPLAVTPAETISNIATRRTENWSVAIELTSPGEEWIRIGSATKSGGAVSAGNGQMELYFEGNPNNSYDEAADWGSGNDRNNDRRTYGVKSLRRFVRAVQTQLTEFRGEAAASDGWWTSVSSAGAKSLRALNTDKLERNGSNTITGDILPDGDAGRSLGSAVARFLGLHTRDLRASTLLSPLAPNANHTLDLGTDALQFRRGHFETLHVDTITSTNNGGVNIGGNNGANNSQINLNTTLGADAQSSIVADGAVGVNQLDITSGNVGQRPIRLRGRDVKLSTICEGQDGLAFVTGTVVVGANTVDPNVSNVYVGTFPAPASGSINTTDRIIGWFTTLDFGALFVTNIYLSGVNEFSVNILKTGDSGTLPASDQTWTFEMVILRRP